MESVLGTQGTLGLNIYSNVQSYPVGSWESASFAGSDLGVEDELMRGV